MVEYITAVRQEGFRKLHKGNDGVWYTQTELSRIKNISQAALSERASTYGVFHPLFLAPATPPGKRAFATFAEEVTHEKATGDLQKLSTSPRHENLIKIKSPTKWERKEYDI